VRIYFRNKGSVPAYAPVIAAQSRTVERPLSDPEVAALTEETNNGAFLPVTFDKDRPQIDTDQEYQKLAPGVAITIADLQTIQSNKKFFYLFLSMTYTDDYLAPKTYWLTEYASSLHGNTNQPSVFRSRAYLKKAQ
jgi:hypothetical protein